jgi:hypothetical protein
MSVFAVAESTGMGSAEIVEAKAIAVVMRAMARGKCMVFRPCRKAFELSQ